MFPRFTLSFLRKGSQRRLAGYRLRLCFYLSGQLLQRLPLRLYFLQHFFRQKKAHNSDASAMLKSLSVLQQGFIPFI
jgi:hypothetical protein